VKVAILTDTTKCINCHECVSACKRQNHLEADVPRRWDLNDGLSARNWTSIVEGPQHTYARKQCRHCLEPACVSACPVGALHRTAYGAVIYDAAKCMGCRYCMMACPYGIPRYEWQSAVPFIRKCIFCNDRLEQGQQPACTEACPTKATIFGDRDQLIAEARRRIVAEPGKYLQHIFGEHESGGTSVLYVYNADLKFLNEGRAVGPAPLPSTTSAVMHAVPFTFAGVVAIMGGITWIIDRRMKLERNPESGSAEETSHEEKSHE
jgi:formate dehydrogenase iron-sulfur subunit